MKDVSTSLMKENPSFYPTGLVRSIKKRRRRRGGRKKAENQGERGKQSRNLSLRSHQIGEKDQPQLKIEGKPGKKRKMHRQRCGNWESLSITSVSRKEKRKKGEQIPSRKRWEIRKRRKIVTLLKLRRSSYKSRGKDPGSLPVGIKRKKSEKGKDEKWGARRVTFNWSFEKTYRESLTVV